MPLQAFAPWHATVPAFALVPMPGLAHPDANKAAAEAAIANPASFFPSMTISFQVGGKHAGIGTSGSAPAYYECPPAFSQSDALIDIQPWPLQEFCPLQELFAEAHSLWPLQEFTP
jgi:hypothetical protein